MHRVFLTFLLCLLPSLALAHGGEIVVAPAVVKQGEPFMITLKGVQVGELKKLTFNGKPVPFFQYQGRPVALIGVDLASKTGKFALTFTSLDGDEGKATVTVQKRAAVSAPLGIPEKLGGNTKKSQQNLAANLAKENGVLTRVKAGAAPLWNAPFQFPLKETMVTDAYGYSRKTGSYSIPHKGVDFRAATGTPVMAINDGIVRIAREFVVYGKTVVIDHGAGIVSLYMHLSDIRIREGQKVARGHTIGLTGESGYALSPHLHLSLRIHGVSVDPMKFFPLFDVGGK